MSQRLGKIMLASSLAVAVVMSFLAIWGFRSSQEAKQQVSVALARQLAIQAQSINAASNSQQLIAILLATQSLNVFPSSEAAQLLMNNNLAAQAIAHMTHYYAVSSVAFSPDGKHVVSASYDSTISGMPCLIRQFVPICRWSLRRQLHHDVKWLLGVARALHNQ